MEEAPQIKDKRKLLKESSGEKNTPFLCKSWAGNKSTVWL